MTSLLSYCVAVLFLIGLCSSAPVDPRKKDTENEHDGNNLNEELPDYKEMGIEYGRYLQEIVKILESDPKFKEKLANATEEDIKSGAIAKHLRDVDPDFRSKLDEAKRVELERIKQYVKKQHDIDIGSYGDRKWRVHADPVSQYAGHVHDVGSHKFEEEDLKKLILDTSHKMEKWDEKRREEFKQYEMEKEHQYREQLKNMTEDQRKEAEKKHQEELDKKKHHPKVHHPGSKQQLEEVWSEQDHLPKEEFDPKTFFALHDLNGDGYWDEEEVKSLLTLEIQKLYDSKDKNTDLNEMHEEYERMREHIYKEGDKDNNRLISKQEFLDLAKAPEFEKDPEWKSVAEEPVYKESEYEEYAKTWRPPPRDHEYLQYQHDYYPQYYQVPPTGAYHPDQGHPQYGYQQPPPGVYPPPPQGYQPPPPHYQGGPGYPQDPGHPQNAQYGYNPQAGGQYPPHPQDPNHPQNAQYGHPQGAPQYGQAQGAQYGHAQGGPQYGHDQGAGQFQPPPPQGGQPHPGQGAPQYQGGQGVPQYQAQPAGNQQPGNIPQQHGVPAGNQPNVASPQGVPSSQPHVTSNQGNPNVAANVPQPAGGAAHLNTGYQQQPNHN